MIFLKVLHCVKSVRIRSYSGLHFPTFGLNTYLSVFSPNAGMLENVDQSNSEYRHLSGSVEKLL